jgi:hypothetical protein
VKSSPLAVVLLAVLALAGCTAPAPSPEPATEPGTDSCAAVTVVVDFGVLEAPAVHECVEADPATAALDAAGVATEGTVDWGDQVVCRVNERPGEDETVTVDGQEPFIEACQSMPAATAYWALWVKTAADAEWEYAQEGLATLQLQAGQSVGLVYTTGSDSTPPGD